MLFFGRGHVGFSLSRDFGPNEDYNYAYIPIAPNEKLIFSYGFYFENNTQSAAIINSYIVKKYYTKEKHELCKVLGLIQEGMEQFILDPKKDQTEYRFKLSPYYLAKETLNFLRIYVFNPNEITQERLTLMYKRIKANKPINYISEMTALALFRHSLYHTETMNKVKLPEILSTMHLTREYYKKNRELFLFDSYLRYKYRLRRKMIYLAYENRMIIAKNIGFALDEMGKNLKDSYGKIKKHFLSNFQ